MKHSVDKREIIRISGSIFFSRTSLPGQSNRDITVEGGVDVVKQNKTHKMKPLTVSPCRYWRSLWSKYSAWNTMYTIRYNAKDTIYRIQCIVYNAKDTMHRRQYIL